MRNKTDLFENASQLIVLIFNLADTWFIGRTGNPYMIAASSLTATVYFIVVALPFFYLFLVCIGDVSFFAELVYQPRVSYKGCFLCDFFYTFLVGFFHNKAIIAEKSLSAGYVKIPINPLG